VVERFTQIPRCTLWLLRGGDCTIGGGGPDSRPTFVAEVAPLYISKGPITNIQYEAFQPGRERWPSSREDDAPVVGVDWRDAVAYCRWYSELSKKRFRLPTEVEWEFACRGGREGRFWWGEDPATFEGYGWDLANSGSQARVIEGKRANPAGLYDMLGNVWEWTSSLHQPYPVVDADGREDMDASGPRVARGGSFRVARDELGIAERLPLSVDTQRDDLGFRIVRLL